MDGSTSLTVAQTHTLTITASSEYTGDYSWGGYVANQYPGILISVEGENHDILKIYNGTDAFKDIDLSGINVSINGYKNTIKHIVCPQKQTSFSYRIYDSGLLVSSNIVISYGKYIEIQAEELVHVDSFSWAGFTEHDNVTFHTSGAHNECLKITNNNASKTDVNFSGITLSCNNVKLTISENIICDTGAIEYSFKHSNGSSASPIITYGSSVEIWATCLHQNGQFRWGGYTAQNGITFTLVEDDHSILLITNNNSTNTTINFSSIWVWNNGYQDYIDETVVCQYNGQ